MKRLDFRKKIKAIIGDGYSHLAFEDLMAELEVAIVEVACDKGWPTPNTGKAWSDDDLALVLSEAPTKMNTLKFAKFLGRGYGSVEQVYRWAATSDKEIRAKRSKDKFVAQIKRVAKRLGWRA